MIYLIAKEDYPEVFEKINPEGVVMKSKCGQAILVNRAHLEKVTNDPEILNSRPCPICGIHSPKGFHQDYRNNAGCYGKHFVCSICFGKNDRYFWRLFNILDIRKKQEAAIRMLKGKTPANCQI